MVWIAEWIAKRAFKKALKRIKRKALAPEQITEWGDAIRDRVELKLEQWSKEAAASDSEYDDAAILLAQTVFKSSYLEKKRNGNN